MQGGAIYLLGDSIVQISGTKFTDNIAERKGGAISAESFKSISISGGSYFSGNIATKETGDSLYAFNSQ